MKKRNFVRLLSLFLALLMMAAIFAGCKKAEEGEAGDTTADAQGAGDNATPIEGAYDANTEGVIDLSEYKIVRPKEMVTSELGAVNALKQYINEICGVEIVAATDAKADKNDAKEILMGLTNRQASKDAAADMKAHDWKITANGNKIVIIAGDKASLVSATNWLIENKCFQKGNKYAKIGNGTSYAHEYAVSELKAGDKVLDNVSVVVSAKESISFVDIATNFADEMTYIAGIDTTVSTRVVDGGVNIQLMSASQATDHLPAGLTLGSMQYAIVKNGDDIVIAAYDDVGAELGAQQLLKAMQNANKGSLDVYSLCKNEAVTYTYGANANDTLMLSDGAEYRIMQYNILRTEAGTGRFGYAINTIKYYSPDVVAFEEYCKDYTANFTPMLEAAGYTVLGNQLEEVVNDTGTEVRPLYPLHQNNTPIAFKTEKFELLDCGWKRMIDSTDPVQNGHGWNGYNMTWAVLKDKTTGKIFGVTSLHNFAGSNDLAIPTRTKVVNDLIDIVKTNIVDTFECPVFSIGDYNTTELNDDYNAMVTSDVLKYSDCRYVAEKSYAQGRTTHAVGEYNTVLGDASATIDHLFVTGDASVVRHRFGNVMEAVKSTDHYTVYIDVRVG